MKLISRFASISLALILAAAAVPAASAQGSPLGLPNGVMQADGTYQYTIVRNDLTPTLNGAAVNPGVLASGYLNIRPLANNRSFVVGTVPVLESELQQVLNLFNMTVSLTITSIDQEATVSTPRVLFVHFQGTDTNESLYLAIGTFAQVGGGGADPGDVFIPVTPIDPATIIPAQYADLTHGISVNQFTPDVYEVQIPRPERDYTVAGYVATKEIGLGETFYVQTLDNGNLIVNVKLTINQYEVPVILNYLESNGWTINSINSRFVDDAPRHTLTLCATYSGTTEAVSSTLFAAIGNIFGGSNAPR